MEILKGIKVVELGMYLPLPYTGAFLKKMGAKVIKIEQPKKGDPLLAIDSKIYGALNSEKEVVYLDLKDIKDINRIKKKLLTADIVLNGFRRGFLDKIGLGFGEISNKNKKIIYINLYGYSKNISLKDKAGHDLNFLALSGMFDHLKGWCKPLPIQVADMAGALWAIIGSLVMLKKREKEGKGGELELSLFSSLISFLPFFYFSKEDSDISKGLLYGESPFYNLYECSDGKLMAVGSLEEKFAKRLLEILKIEYNGNIFSEDNRIIIYDKLKRAFKSKKQDYFIKLFESEDICITPVFSKKEFFQFFKDALLRRDDLKEKVFFPIK